MELVDDEVLYTMPDMHGDFISAYWNLLTGHYKTAASCLRNALEIGAVGLYFMLRTDAGKDDYERWDVGEMDTPNWGSTRGVLEKAAAAFDHTHSSQIVAATYALFKELCSYTHSKPYTEVGGHPSNTMSLVGGNFPGFEEDVFERLTSLALQVIESLGILWLACYPDVVKFRKHWGDDPSYFAKAFDTPLGSSALTYAFSNAGPLDP